MKVDKGALELVAKWDPRWQELFTDLFHEAMEDVGKDEALEWAFNLCMKRRNCKRAGWKWARGEDGWWSFGPPQEETNG